MVMIMNYLNERARMVRASIQNIDYVLEQYPLTFAEASIWLNRRAEYDKELREIIKQLKSDS